MSAREWSIGKGSSRTPAQRASSTISSKTTTQKCRSRTSRSVTTISAPCAFNSRRFSLRKPSSNAIAGQNQEDGMSNNRFSRRDFLQSTAGAAGALAAAPGMFLKPEYIPSALEKVAPSDRLRFGIIGIGMQGSGLLTAALTLPGVECVAACHLYDGRPTLA